MRVEKSTLNAQSEWHLESWPRQACFGGVWEDVAEDEVRMELWGPDHRKPAKAFEFYLKGIIK